MPTINAAVPGMYNTPSRLFTDGYMIRVNPSAEIQQYIQK